MFPRAAWLLLAIFLFCQAAMSASKQVHLAAPDPSFHSLQSLKLLSWNIRYAPSFVQRVARRVQHTAESSASFLWDMRSKDNQKPFPGFGKPTDGEHSWNERRTLIADTVAWEEPDLCTFQEVLHHQLVDLDNMLPQYDYVGVGRNDGKHAGEAVPIFYRRDKFSLIAVTHFWLSKTPDVPGSSDWDAGNPRMVTVARLRPILPTTSDELSETKTTSCDLLDHPHPEDLFVVNTHFDDRGAEARYESAKLILKKLGPLLSTKRNLVILGGDMNSRTSDNAYRTLVGKSPKNIDDDDGDSASSRSKKNLHFIDSRYHLTTAPEHPSESVYKDKSAVQNLIFPYAQSLTWTGFSNHEDRYTIDFIMIGNTGAIKKPSNLPPIIPKEEESGYSTLDQSEPESESESDEIVDLSFTFQKEKRSLKYKKAKWIIDRYGVLPTRYEYKPRASDHRPVVARFRRDL